MPLSSATGSESCHTFLLPERVVLTFSLLVKTFAPDPLWLRGIFLPTGFRIRIAVTTALLKAPIASDIPSTISSRFLPTPSGCASAIPPTQPHWRPPPAWRSTNATLPFPDRPAPAAPAIERRSGQPARVAHRSSPAARRDVASRRTIAYSWFAPRWALSLASSLRLAENSLGLAFALLRSSIAITVPDAKKSTVSPPTTARR